MKREGDTIVIATKRKPIFILHALSTAEETESSEKRLIALASGGRLRLPKRGARFARIDPCEVKGRPLSEMIIEDRR